MLPRITEALATTCRSVSIVPESLLANGSGQKFIARLPRDWSRSLHHGLKKARTESVQGYALPARFLCRFWYLCWNLTNLGSPEPDNSDTFVSSPQNSPQII